MQHKDSESFKQYDCKGFYNNGVSSYCKLGRKYSDVYYKGNKNGENFWILKIWILKAD